MKLSHLKLTNFRCYQNLEMDLHPQVTVLVAENGQGKTTLLDAIRIALWPYVSSFDLARTAYADPANTVVIDDIHLAFDASKMARQLPCLIEASGDYGCGETTWGRLRDSEARKSQTKDDKATRELKAWAKSLQQNARDVQDDIDLPVFGYYGTGRLWKEKRLTASKKGSNKTKREQTDEQINTFAYRDCLDPASSYKQFEEWYIGISIQLLESQIEIMQSGAAALAVEDYLMDPVEVIQKATNELLKATGWQDVAYSQKHDKTLVLRHDEKGVLKVDQLSDGIKNMLAMVADIAYRCYHLNPHLGVEAALKAKGIVLIDEVDMHLHPKWQQTVIQGLTTAFPNIQFVVTTHSPQVLSTVAKDSIRIVSEGKLLRPSINTLGEESRVILEDLMHVPSRPKDPMSEKLKAYLEKVNRGDIKSQIVQGMRKQLDEHYGTSHSQLRLADMVIHKWLAVNAAKAKKGQRKLAVNVTAKVKKDRKDKGEG